MPPTPVQSSPIKMVTDDAAAGAAAPPPPPPPELALEGPDRPAKDAREQENEDPLPVPTPGQLEHNAAQEEEEEETARPEREAPWSLITLDELELGEQLGSGGNGTVHAAQWRGETVAVKTLHRITREQLATIEAELLVQAPLVHAGVVRLLGACLVPPSCCIVLEHCTTSLFARLYKDPSPIERSWVVHVACNVAHAMAYLHGLSPPLVHRDLKSPNVLLASDGRTSKLCDFGLVGTREPTAGTPNYMAPELLEARSWSTPVDVYAFGVLLNELFVREVPWDGFQPFDIKQKVLKGERPAISLTMPLACERLLQRAWHQDAHKRPTFEEAVVELEKVKEMTGGGAQSHGLPPLPPDALDSLM